MENEENVVESTESEFDTEGALETLSADLGFAEVSETPSAEEPAGEVVVEPASETPSAGETAQAAPASSPLAAPKTWRPEAAAKWEATPPEVQAEILKREDDMFRGLETYKNDANIGKGVKSVLEPYLPILKQHNIDPLVQISGLMRAHYALVTGSPEEKQAMFAKLASDYGIQADSGEAPYVDPQVASLRQELQTLKSTVQGREAQEAERSRNSLAAEINTFASDPAHAYFDEVANDIAGLLRSGSAKDLAEAYEKAVWANPTTRAKEQARLTAEALANAQKAAQGKAQAAKKAVSANVKSSARPASGTAPAGSIDDTLNAALTDIKSRH